MRWWCWHDINHTQWPEITFMRIAMQTSGPAIYALRTQKDTWCPEWYTHSLTLRQNTQCLIGTNKCFMCMAFTRFCALSFLFFLPDCVYLPGCEVKSCLVPTLLLCFLQVSHILLVRVWAGVHSATPLTIVLVGKSSQIS